MQASPDDKNYPFPHTPVPPELLAYARQTFDEREYLEELRELKENGGYSLEAVIAEIEAKVCGS